MSRAYFSWQQSILEAKLEPTTKLVCLTIGCHMAADGSGCFPSYGLIADESGLSRRSVIEHVAKAVEAGYLTTEGRLRDNGSSTSNSYRPVMPGGVNVVHQGGEPGSLGGSEPAAPLITTQSSNYPPNHCARFEEFWSAYPNKENRKGCLALWKRERLDAKADEILAGVKRWKTSDRWQRGFIKGAHAFLNQEMWKVEPPPSELKRGEVRVRESTPAERKAAEQRARFMEVMKLNPGKSEAEIVRMMNQNGRAL